MTNKADVQLSKTLSWLLRHGAVKEGLQIKVDGYIPVLELLKHKSLRGKYTVADIKRVVTTNDKKRFSLREDNVLEICANQGHSLPDIDNLNLTNLDGTENIDVIHGTYFRNWHNIKREGISRMKRNHIHFALGLPGDKKVISGIRSDAEIFIYINFKLAINDNVKFHRSVNSVILSPGNEDGIVLPKYFLNVIDNKGRKLL